MLTFFAIFTLGLVIGYAIHGIQIQRVLRRRPTQVFLVDERKPLEIEITR